MPPRELSRLGHEAKRNMTAKGEAVREKTNASRAAAAIAKLSREVRHVPASKDEMLQKRLSDAWNKAKKHEAKTDGRLRGIETQLSDIREELSVHLENARAILRKAENAKLSGISRANLDGITAERKKNIITAKEIIAAMDGQDPKFAEMLRMATPYYDRAEIVSDAVYDGNDTRDFTGHTIRHIVEVRGKMRDMITWMPTIGFSGGDFFSAATMDAAAAFHDTGMDANISHRFAVWFAKAFKGNVTDMGADWKPRDKHAVVGAMHILDGKNRGELASMGANVDQAAFLIDLHSKKGYLEGMELRDLSKTDFSHIKNAAENFARACKRTGVAWDMSWLKNGDSWNEENLRKTAISASALRLADASRDGLNLYAQKGAGYSISNTEAARGHETITDEVSIAYDYGDGRTEEIKPFVGATSKQIDKINKTRSIVFGENNVELMDLGTTRDGKLIYRFIVREPESGTVNTADVIRKRLNEIRSTVFGNLEAFGGSAAERIIEITSGGGSTKKIADLLEKDIPEGWSVVMNG